jgi:DNA-binding response OmpR family regulator
MTRARILVVDDEPALRMIMGQLLRREGHEVVEAGSAESARAWLEKSPVPVDLAVVDLRLPGVSGEVFGHWLVGQNEHAKVLFVSGMGDAVPRVPGLPPGAVDFLGKPFLPDDLVARVSRLLHIPGAVHSRESSPSRVA